MQCRVEKCHWENLLIQCHYVSCGCSVQTNREYTLSGVCCLTLPFGKTPTCGFKMLPFGEERTLVSGEMRMVNDTFQPSVFYSPSLEGGWVGWRDDTEENLGIRTTHGQLPLLIHLPYRHFLSFSTLAKLLVRGGGWQRIHIQRGREKEGGWIHEHYRGI